VQYPTLQASLIAARLSMVGVGVALTAASRRLATEAVAWNFMVEMALSDELSV
jgi:hypothetical protein